MAPGSTHQPSMSAVRLCRLSHRPRVHALGLIESNVTPRAAQNPAWAREMLGKTISGRPEEVEALRCSSPLTRVRTSQESTSLSMAARRSGEGSAHSLSTGGGSRSRPERWTAGNRWNAGASSRPANRSGSASAPTTVSMARVVQHLIYLDRSGPTLLRALWGWSPLSEASSRSG